MLPNKESSRPRRSYNISTVARLALKIIAGASVTTSALLVLQLVWIVLKTPRLPPPPFSGEEFVREGRVVKVDDVEEENDDGDEEKDDDIGVTTSSSNTSKKEFRLVLIGDSPVEGIGNNTHQKALSGRTARAFAKKLACEGEEYDTVRYWSYGKSGLTARGIEKKMLPYLYRVVDDMHRMHNSTNQNIDGHAIHAIILLCGVNNVLDPLSTATSFHSEVLSLSYSIRCRPGLENTPLIVLGLPDFSRLPFLPWPLSFALGLRARKMQRALELAVRAFQQKEKDQVVDSSNNQRGKTAKTFLVNVPDVQNVFGTIGYHRYDSSVEKECNANSTGHNPTKKSISGPLKVKLVHPLFRHLGDRLDQSKLGSLRMEDFLSPDRFHPGKRGTVYIGSLIAEAYYSKFKGGTRKK